ncbi:MAG: hypothetical protein ACP5D7_25450 [Limnospira sp.]
MAPIFQSEHQIKDNIFTDKFGRDRTPADPRSRHFTADIENFTPKVGVAEPRSDLT